MSQIVDTESAREFMKETLAKVQEEELSAIAADLERKSAAMRQWLALERLGELDETRLRRLLRWIFPARRRVDDILKHYPPDALVPAIGELLYGEEQAAQRLARFVQKLDALPYWLRIDLAGEMLHFAYPERHWLWCRWLCDPQKKTGSLPLVVTEDYDFDGKDDAERYLKVGRATIFVHQVGEAAGFQNISRSLFGTDVYLCAVYVIYAYTVLRLRMTQEFNKVVPGLSEFARRLLGVYRMEEYEGIA